MGVFIFFLNIDGNYISQSEVSGSSVLAGGSIVSCSLQYASVINAKSLGIPSVRDFERLYLLKHLCSVNQRLDIPKPEFKPDW